MLQGNHRPGLWKPDAGLSQVGILAVNKLRLRKEPAFIVLLVVFEAGRPDLSPAFGTGTSFVHSAQPDERDNTEAWFKAVA